jgi:hypothetical protein
MQSRETDPGSLHFGRDDTIKASGLFLDQPLLTGRSPHLLFFLANVQGLPLPKEV